MSPETDQPADSGAKTGTDKTWDQFNRLRRNFPALIADTAACVRFFSRLPLEKVNVQDDPAAVPDFEKISRAAPIAGVAVALPAAGLGMLLGYTTLPVLAIAALIATMLAVTTGALHEDGLSDVADGFFGGSTRQKRLDIMKDSRIGAFGALALVLSVILRVALLAALWQRFDPADAALLFLGGEAASRAFIVWQWQQRPLARPDGLAARFGKPDKNCVRQAFLFTAPFLLPAVLLLTLPGLLLACLIPAALAFGIGHLANQKIGGVSGDVLGAIQQICALGFLLGMLMVP
ncbi:adenosylcobinamide-GDP ribazoletransferase [uncultured Roseibium sp.]|uniref:adenosylcobinamide-GDP ribazoletransferase n=1 Tax=uncultured Roseibium sp. TaxID=1936171 RepID=UPI0026144DC2|nr:adenosylcobinamide-GDP ribazoletransferase [uncultured Roseibium sp.]